jgi:ribosomal protein S18 acetylase RimI-like enzyme
MHSAHLREFQQPDASAVNALGVAAFGQFANHYQDWPVFQQKIACMAALAETGEIIVAATDSKIFGAVAYLGPQAPKSEFFPTSWAVMRMLVVSPECRGQGLGRTLAQACFARAQRDGAEVFGLHTSPIMSIALPMYLRMGFKFVREAPSIHGIEYGIYAKHLT